jgi:hypothetical protein
MTVLYCFYYHLAHWAGLLHHHQALNQTHIAWVYKAMYAEVTLAGLRLLGKKVTLERLIPADLSGSCNSEGFLRT